MKKCSVVSIIFILFTLLTACIDDKVIIPVTGNPSAQAVLNTMTDIAKTVEVLGRTATAYSFTPTLTKAPTNTPDQDAVTKMISDSIDGQLISTFGARITVAEVKFGPIGAQEYTNLYIEINCTGDNNVVCPIPQVIIAVMDACKEKKKKVLENVPGTTQVMAITIFDPKTLPKVVEINWSDVRAYMDGNMTGDVLSRLIRYVQ
jgi:hypothetical protein